MLYSLRLAAATDTVAVLLGTVLAYLGTHGAGRVGPVLEGISLWTISIPGLILAAGYVFLWNEPWLVPLHLDLAAETAATAAVAAPARTRAREMADRRLHVMITETEME